MKRSNVSTVTLLLVTLVLAVGMASADSKTIIKANVPFDFNIGDQTFAAGEYSVIQPLQHMIALRDARGRTISFAFTNDVLSGNEGPDASTLRFQWVGGRRELVEVWTLGNPSGLHLNSATPLKKASNDDSAVASVSSTTNRR